MAIHDLRTKYVAAFALIAAVACAKGGDGAAPAQQPPLPAAPSGPVAPSAQAPSPTPAPPVPAEPSQVLCVTESQMKAGSKTLAEARKGLKGQFDVASVVVQQVVKDQRRGEVAWASRGFQASKDRSGRWRENRLPDCIEGVHATLDMSVLVPQVVHFGSGRITVYDAGDDMDRTATNFPAIRQLGFNRDELVYIIDRESLGRAHLNIADIPGLNADYAISFEEISKDGKRGFAMILTQSRPLGSATLVTLVRVHYLPDSIVR